MSTLPPPTVAAATTSSYTCPYCRLPSDTSGTSCPHCGAPVDIRAKVSSSGWERQPPIEDLARIQFGQSSCQVSGTYVPVAEMRLAAGQSVYFSHQMLLWADTQVQLAAQPMRGAWNRAMAGMPLVMMEATGPGNVAFSDNHAGETIAVPLMPGRTIDVREHRFLVATQNVTYEWFQSGIWYRTRNGDETETHYPAGMYLDRFSAQAQPGLLLLHSPGNVFVRDLAAGETICIHPGSLVWKDTSAGMAIHLERAKGTSWVSWWAPSTPWLRVWGPGRVAVSSRFERMESTGRITGTSQGTQVDWNRYVAPTGAVAAAPAVSRIDDAAVKAAVDALAVQHGFQAVADQTAGPTTTHVYRHASGMEVRVGIVGSSTSSIASTITNTFGPQSSAFATGAANLFGSIAKAANRVQGQPVQGLGDEASWRAGNGASDLVVTKNDHTVQVRVTAPVPPDQHYGWAWAFASAAVSAL